MHADVFVVVDVLRFTTSACYALANGARSIVPCETLEQALLVKAATPDLLLAGERNAVRPEGFDFGNSPLEFTRDAVQGRDLVWTTTNGTRAITMLLGGTASDTPAQADVSNPVPAPVPALVPRPFASIPSPFLQQFASIPSPFLPRPSNSCDLFLASPVNLTAIVSLLEPRLRENSVVAIVCSGREGGFALEDSACAGTLVRRLRAAMGSTLTLDDGARACACISEAYGEDFARLFRDAQHGRFLRDHGFASDLDACAALDTLQVVPRWWHGRFVAG